MVSVLLYILGLIGGLIPRSKISALFCARSLIKEITESISCELFYYYRVSRLQIFYVQITYKKSDNYMI